MVHCRPPSWRLLIHPVRLYALPLVLPHQPRVDFQLWFHGLSARGRLPSYLVRLEQLLCEAPATVAPLFVTQLPQHARAVQIRYATYHFTRDDEVKQPPGAVWRRELQFERPEFVCKEVEGSVSNPR